MKYTDQFIETCFGFEEGNKLRYAFGAALYHAEEIMGKIVVLYGGPATGKSSILEHFQYFTYDDRKIMVSHDFNLKRIKELWLSNDEVMFLATNELPESSLSDHIIVINTSGNRMPLEDWKKFKQEMEYCPEDFFRSCMQYYTIDLWTLS